MSVIREELIRQHIIHEFDASLSYANLSGCYGRMTRWFYDRLLRHIVGDRVLDAGCGCGLFSSVCLGRGLRVHAIDIDEESLAMARSLYGIECRNESVYQTSLRGDSIDTVFLNDVICHLDIPQVLAEVKRLGARRVIVHDSNIRNPMLRAYRHKVGHEERHYYEPDELAQAFREGGYAQVELSFGNILCLPVSGGLQRRPLPILGRFPKTIYFTDQVCGLVLNLVRLDRWFAFRYTAVFDRRVAA